MPKHKHDEKPHKHDHHGPEGDRAAEHLSGVIEAYNFSPKGNVEGLLLNDGRQTIQINITPETWSMAAHAVSVGNDVRIVASPEPATHDHPDAEHPVYRLISLTPASRLAADDHEPSHDGTVSVEGIITRFNYARHGEPNGVVLDNGDFVHLKPHGMKKVGLHIGQQVVAQGKARPTVLGHRVIEAEVVAGVVLGPKHP
jgi:hypothetical protein